MSTSETLTNADQKREKALQDVKLYLANDWELKAETPEYFLLKRSSATLGKHLLLFVFTWWTLGVANLIYYFMAQKEKKIVK